MVKRVNRKSKATRSSPASKHPVNPLSGQPAAIRRSPRQRAPSTATPLLVSNKLKKSTPVSSPAPVPPPDLPQQDEQHEVLSLSSNDDLDSQTRRFLHLTMADPHDKASPVDRHPAIPAGDLSGLPQLPSSTVSPHHPLPGHLLAPLPYRKNWLSTWLEMNWYDYIPQGWRRMKNHKFDDSNTGLPITAIILAGQGFMARLCKADLVSCSAAATCVGILCDAGYGPNGTLRAKNTFESLIQQVAAAVADNRTADVDLLTHHGRSPTLEQICTTFTGFSAPPQTSPQQKSTKSSNPWAKSYNWWEVTSTTGATAPTTTITKGGTPTRGTRVLSQDPKQKLWFFYY